ncbi:bifunctional 4-hydroxy-2-oxoglutarate aldolase/2-dehydro-3-deoxy-phosphogluconate aldolase [Microbacterium sulfonylureivorans]|uniref:bifunctional 4-hydroxy-2-oxoglutarate aldolase/2-dehydro-3-deoxy-phosphogluconate aldolase n=1 Tax=Microbacterium sulfonylureivorans TaxID=2486854 RepID=UPI0013E024A6|nr:bifunctional 4-hydroxy-2-oxoglutarate aldolase/2-dehydro-3-deoxy-phosphogluconate aldolase [Microbacterium sulfonylureivorans]
MNAPPFGPRRELIPTVGALDPVHAEAFAAALTAGGVRYLEILLRDPQAWQLLDAMTSVPGIRVGAGTILDADGARRARDAGAAFLVSPGLDVDLANAIRSLDIPYIPGVATASDLMRARGAGLHHVKVFPAEQIGGSAALSALSAPFPDMQFMPSGGVDESRLTAYCALSQVFAVGGSWLIDAASLATGDFSDVTSKACSAVAIISGSEPRGE